MRESKQKSRTFRRISKKTPGGKLVTHYERRKPAKAICTMCGNVLKGVIQAIPSKVKAESKTKRRPERPFGGVLCSACTRNVLKQKVRQT